MTDIYEQFDAAFSRISAYAVLHGDKFIGRVCFKHPRDGAGRLYCYAQVWGATMARGYAGGGGYDKHSAAAESAIARLRTEIKTDPETIAHMLCWQESMRSREGERWNTRLEQHGYSVRHVIA